MYSRNFLSLAAPGLLKVPSLQRSFCAHSIPYEFVCLFVCFALRFPLQDASPILSCATETGEGQIHSWHLRGMMGSRAVSDLRWHDGKQAVSDLRWHEGK